MRVIANGDPLDLDDGALLTDLLAALGLGTKWVVAELNGDAIDRVAMGVTELHDGDRVELVRAVAGGADG